MDRLKEVNSGKELQTKKVKINGKSFVKYETDEFKDEEMEGKRVLYVFSDNNMTILVETIDTTSDKNEISEIINSVKFNLNYESTE